MFAAQPQPDDIRHALAFIAADLGNAAERLNRLADQRAGLAQSERDVLVQRVVFSAHGLLTHIGPGSIGDVIRAARDLDAYDANHNPRPSDPR